MPAPAEIFKLPRGMGRLIRYLANGPWTWQSWDRRRQKWATTPTHEVNRSRAEQNVYQQIALRDGEKFRYQGVSILFTTVADAYMAARKEGRNCKKE